MAAACAEIERAARHGIAGDRFEACEVLAGHMNGARDTGQRLRAELRLDDGLVHAAHLSFSSEAGSSEAGRVRTFGVRHNPRSGWG